MNNPMIVSRIGSKECTMKERTEPPESHASAHRAALRPSGPTLLELCERALYVGYTGYGGPAVLAHIKKIFVDEKQWLSERDFMAALSLAQILPGAAGVSLMGYIGHKLRKPWGGILVPACFVLPAAVLMLVASWAYFRYHNLRLVQSLFAGLGALVVALLVNATLMLGRSVFKKMTAPDYKGALIALCMFAGLYFVRVNVVLLTLTAGGLGLLLYSFGYEISWQSPVASLNAAPRQRQSYWVPLAMLAAIAALCAFIAPWRQMFVTFFNIGAFAFGGGFATIPLIQGKVVDQLGWLSLAQFRDGIALGQITPGPVFITATFIGYKVLGIAGATVATIAIFIPSLAAMIVLSEAHDAVRNLKQVKAAIRGIQAGFIGLLTAVTVQFALKSLTEWQSWLIFCSSLALILYYKKNVLWMIAGTIIVSAWLFR
jgi:chromate transporter